MFAGTVAQNIALGEYEPDMDKILSIAQNLDMMEFIDKLPQRFAIMVGENGALLYGGKKITIPKSFCF